MIGIIGCVIFLLTDVMVRPLSLIANWYFGSNYTAVAIILIFRYTVVSFIVGLASWTMSYKLHERSKAQQQEVIPTKSFDGSFQRRYDLPNDEESEM